MADQMKEDQLHQPHGSRNLEEAAPIFSDKSLPRRRRIKFCGIALAVVILQIVVIGVLCLTVFRFRDPKVTMAGISVENLSMVVGNPTTINVTLREEIKVENANWGRLKYDQSIVVLSHEGVTVGEATVSKGSIAMRRSKEVSVSVEAKIDSGGGASGEIGSGVLNLKSYMKVSGKVEMVGMVRKRRSGKMDCSFTISLTRQAIQEFHCQ
ncbi:hypothetical protein C1H46_013070 [Malus baccata]|uniref:Late embryogenesis abundant protein LEA-2 subgroup domain-containing protein n=1 Tax=Malus baccata TaxID=106549 RepID=A0A540MR83_MALBA|nr:hypothetical protein C1H46_013070 [Malus baccata]